MRVTIFAECVCVMVVLMYSIYICLQVLEHRVEQRSNRSDVTVLLHVVNRVTTACTLRDYHMHTKVGILVESSAAES
jgi:hypothetical protein